MAQMHLLSICKNSNFFSFIKTLLEKKFLNPIFYYFYTLKPMETSNKRTI